MQLWYGGYPFQVNATKIATRKTTILDAAGRPYDQQVVFSCAGRCLAAGQAACTAARYQMEVALSTPYLDLVFKNDDGSVAFALLNGTSTSGVVITELDFPGELESEFANGFDFAFTAQAHYPIQLNGGTPISLLSFTETITRSGGGPAIDFIETVNAPPQKVILRNFTPYTATQSGSAIGLLLYPNYPAPLWPTALLSAPETEETSPDRQGNTSRGGYAIRWTYRFKSASPLLGLPNIWLAA
jgi:hypothetical protein